jgi:hypothetical protein
LSNDGRSVAIGAPYNDGVASDAGHARVFDVGTFPLCLVSLIDHARLHTFTHNSFLLLKGVDVLIEQHASQADPTTASPILFEVMFPEDVSDFATGDVTVTSTSGEQLIGVVSSVSASQYTVSVDVTFGGVVTASIARAVATTDARGIPNLASTSIDNQVLFDLTRALVDDVVAIEAKLDDKTQCKARECVERFVVEQ